MNSIPDTFKEGDTFRVSGGRASYHPSWDSVTPWVLYYNNGTCFKHVGSFYAALRELGATIQERKNLRIY